MSNSKFPIEEKEKVDSFINQSPNSVYSFDTPGRGLILSELCRNNSLDPTNLQTPSTYSSSLKNDCIKLKIESRHLFEYMQKLGFFCQLPFDPSRTEIECRRIELVTGLKPSK
ncbi:hypothetical protein DFH28DRAFT_1124524 [Melampsora americana]|nr:hypothetical protein DFH28DRAFT_890606 [Melampsora americana]KAH9817123.1 hypothetical protein DFH28DRAFT_1124524 [Melampsora americana]